MCDEQAQQENSLISSQNHGTILVMVAWFLACLLALCTAARIIARCRSERLRHLTWTDDAIIFVAALCALGSTAVISSTVDSGLGKAGCLLSDDDAEQIQIKLFVATILFFLTVSISKGSILLFLYDLAETIWSRASVIVVSIMVLLWTMAVMAGLSFQCEMPTPWRIWTGKCIPLIPFWTAAIAIDIVLEAAVVAISVDSIWRLRESYWQKLLATLLLSLRLILIALSIVRLVYLQPAFDRNTDPTFRYIPYAIATQCHTTLAVLIVCSLCLKPYSHLRASQSQAHMPKSRRSNHWSGATIGGIGGTPYESYDSFAAISHIVREPLTSIQASMSTPNSRSSSRYSLHNDILLPDSPIPKRNANPPPRPPPPSEEQRPDLSMFTRTTTARQPPVVTNLGNLRGKDIKIRPAT